MLHLPLARAGAQRGGRRQRRRQRPAAPRPGAPSGPLGGRLLQPALQLGRPQLQHLDGLQRLGGDAGLAPLGRLGPARAALRQHGAVDDLAARLLGLRRPLGAPGTGGGSTPRASARQARPRAAGPLEPQRLGIDGHELGGHEVRAAPGRRIAREAGVGERLEPVLGSRARAAPARAARSGAAASSVQRPRTRTSPLSAPDGSHSTVVTARPGSAGTADDGDSATARPSSQTYRRPVLGSVAVALGAARSAA